MDIPQRTLPSLKSLQEFYIGQNIEDVPKPAVVLDVALARRHCQAVLDAVKVLNVGFRAHVKTHKARKHFFEPRC